MGAKAKFIEIDTSQMVSGTECTIWVTLENIGEAWGFFRAIPDWGWPTPGWVLTPEYLDLELGISGRQTVLLPVPPSSKFAMLAQHWDWDTSDWITDERRDIGEGGLPMNALLIAGVAILAFVIVKRR